MELKLAMNCLTLFELAFIECLRNEQALSLPPTVAAKLTEKVAAAALTRSKEIVVKLCNSLNRGPHTQPLTVTVRRCDYLEILAQIATVRKNSQEPIATIQMIEDILDLEEFVTKFTQTCRLSSCPPPGP